MTLLGMVGSPGRQCFGDGTCAASRLHEAKAKCLACGSESFDHTTDDPDSPFCLNCGEDATSLLPRGDD